MPLSSFIYVYFTDYKLITTIRLIELFTSRNKTNGYHSCKASTNLDKVENGSVPRRYLQLDAGGTVTAAVGAVGGRQGATATVASVAAHGGRTGTPLRDPPLLHRRGHRTADHHGSTWTVVLCLSTNVRVTKLSLLAASHTFRLSS